MITYQDYEKAMNSGERVEDFLFRAIEEHRMDKMYKTALIADEYDHQRNSTIMNYVQLIFTASGASVEDFTATNNKICSNFFHRLNTQRCTYLLGNGVAFTTDTTKKKLGNKFDINLKKWGYFSLIHGLAFGFWNLDKLHVFPLTEFKPLWDEYDGSLRAGIRFWQLDEDKPLIAVFYEEDGYTKYTSDNSASRLTLTEEKTAYKIRYKESEADGVEIEGEENYSRLPIIPMWGSSLHQSTLIGMREKIDSFDLIRSGFANDLTDCSQIYWILENCGGMNDAELKRFRDRLKIQHIAAVDTDNSKASPYTQEIPYQARKEYLEEIRAGIYEDFGALDVHTVAAGATNDHIDAAYQPMDEEADDFETQVTDSVKDILQLAGIEDDPVFKRNRISNEREQVEMIMLEANYLDDETILNKLPNITIEEVPKILANRDVEANDRVQNANEEIVVEEDEQ